MSETLSWRAQLAAGQATLALRSYGSLPDASPQVLAALETLAEVQVALRDKQPAKAQRHLQARPEGAADIADWQQLEQQLAQLLQASRLLEQHEPEAALALLADEVAPLLTAEAQMLRGTAYIYLNDLAAARAAFDAALSCDPKHYRALTNLGNIALEEGRVTEAIAIYERSLRLNDEFANTHHNLGVAYRRAGQIGKSVRALRKAQSLTGKQARLEAQEVLAGSVRPNGKLLRYLLWGGGAVVLYLILRAQGIL